MQGTDEALVDRARRGEERAFSELYYRYRDWVAAVAFRFCGGREDALDVLQETFTYFFRRLPTFELRCQLKTFLYPVVKHLALNRRRELRRVLPAHEVRGEEQPERTEDVEALLSGLSEVQREVVWMRFVDGMELLEIAEALEIPVGTVKSRLHHAIEELRRRRGLKSHEHGIGDRC